MAVAGLICAGACAWALLAADPPASTRPLVIIDSSGKEQKVKGWTISQGARRLSWLAPAEPGKEEPAREDAPADKPVKGGKAPPRPRPSAGPEALEFREENSTTFVEGILTLIPLEHVQAIEYDDASSSATVKVFQGPKADGDLTLKGSTKYRGINKLTIEADVDKGDLGVAQLKFLGGIPKGIRAVRFDAPQPIPAPAGRPAFVTINDKAQTTPHPVFDLQGLYQGADGNEVLLPTLMFKKTLKVDVGKVQKITAHDSRDPDTTEWTVALKDGTELTLTLLRTITHEGKTLTLEGLLGRTPAGYKLFPLHTITEVSFEEKQADKPGTP
jgi:hypothetical protein